MLNELEIRSKYPVAGVYSYSDAVAGVVTVSPACREINFVNDSDVEGTLAVGGKTFTLKPTESIDERVAEFTSFTVTTINAFRATVRSAKLV